MPFLEDFELLSSSASCSFELKLFCLIKELPEIGVAQGFEPLKAALFKCFIVFEYRWLRA